MNTPLKTYIATEVLPNAVKIDVARKKILNAIADYVVLCLKNREQANLLFICTHNSRRSHLSQIWAQTAAYYFGVNNVFCFSGGTEVTALYPAIANTLQKAGFGITVNSEVENPKYSFLLDKNISPIIAFSKLYNDVEYNPAHNFAAIMTCSNAEQSCPLVNGTDKRFALHYQDPKNSDGTEKQAKTYAERSAQIASEMFFIMEKVANYFKS